MNVCFVLPQMLRKPIGGYKIVYEYANGLCQRGYNVSILFLNENALIRFPLPGFLRKIAIHYFTQIEPSWFVLDQRVKKLSSTDNVRNKLEKTDLAIATGADTIYRTLNLFPKAKIFYFIQGHETWLFPEEDLIKTYSLKTKNIVISNWLKKIVDNYSNEESVILNNPIKTEKYKVNIGLDLRDKYSLGVLYHDSELKGFKDAFEAISKVKKKYPKIKVFMFGTSKPDFAIPKWVEFTLNASQSQTIDIYNKVSIFVCATVKEGFGLTGLEAMACGAALVSTSYEGVKEYAVHGYNALLSPVRDADALSENIIRLLKDDELRETIAQNGINTAEGFSFKNAVDKLEKIINEQKEKTEM